MPEFVSKRLLEQLGQNFERSKSREPWRGHRTKHLRGAVVNRVRPLSKRSLGRTGEGGLCQSRSIAPSIVITIPVGVIIEPVGDVTIPALASLVVGNHFAIAPGMILTIGAGGNLTII